MILLIWFCTENEEYKARREKMRMKRGEGTNSKKWGYRGDNKKNNM
jgi:hypothetical protein